MEYKSIDYTDCLLKILHCVAESDTLYGSSSEYDLPNARRNFKDTVFRMLFRKKTALLSLYNAVNKTNFTNVEDMEITTLENAVYLGMNKELMEACTLLKEYVQFTEKIRENRKTMELKIAVNKAVDDCIKEGILEDFLRKQRAEVIAMSIYEYDQEMHMQVVKEESWEDGLAKGRIEGHIEGQSRMLLLIQHMQDNDEMHLIRKLDDKIFLQQMYDKYNL